MHGNSRWKQLLPDPQVRRWYDNVARGSRHTANVYIQRLGRFCRDHGTTPLGFAGMDQQALNDLVLDLVSEMEAKGYAGSYVHSVVKALKSWLAFRQRSITTGDRSHSKVMANFVERGL